MNTLSSFWAETNFTEFRWGGIFFGMNKDILIQFESHTYVLLIENKKKIIFRKIEYLANAFLEYMKW